MNKILIILLIFIIIFSIQIMAQEKNTLIAFSVERLCPFHFLGYAIYDNIGEIPLIFDVRYALSNYFNAVSSLTIAIPASNTSKFDLRGSCGIIWYLNGKKFKGFYMAFYPLYEYDFFNIINKPVIGSNWSITIDYGYTFNISDLFVIDICLGGTYFNVEKAFKGGNIGFWFHYDIKIGIII